MLIQSYVEIEILGQRMQLYLFNKIRIQKQRACQGEVSVVAVSSTTCVQ